ncbi:MAG: tetratricopeptide repeat protein, partial [Myxococcota bacterium]
ETGSAEECFQRALTLDPADVTAIYNMGVVSQDAGKDRQAIDFYLHALRIEPDLAEAHYNLATVYDRQGEPRAAIRHINEYRKLTR